MTCPNCGRTWFRGRGCNCTWLMISEARNVSAAAADKRKKQEEYKRTLATYREENTKLRKELAEVKKRLERVPEDQFST